MALSYKGIWGYAPLIITLANTREVLYLVNRPGNAVSHEGCVPWIDRAIELVHPHAAVPTFHRRDLTYVGDRIAVTLEGLDLTDYRSKPCLGVRRRSRTFTAFALRVQSHLKPKLIFPRASTCWSGRSSRSPDFPLKGAKDRYILFPASFPLVLKNHPRRAPAVQDAPNPVNCARLSRKGRHYAAALQPVTAFLTRGSFFPLY